MPLLTYPKFQAPDINGVNMAGGLVYFYATGTSTPKDTYSDEAKTVPNANPVVLDARGEADIYLDGEYKIILKTAEDVEVWTVDSFTGNTLAEDLASTATDDGTKGFHLVSYPPLSGETSVSNYEYVYGDLRRYLPESYVTDGSVDYATNIAAALATGYHVTFPQEGGTYQSSTAQTMSQNTDIQLNGSTLKFTVSGAALNLVVVSGCRVLNGVVENAGSAPSGAGQYQCPIIIGDYADGTGYSKINLSNLQIVSNRDDGNGIMITGDSHNITLSNIDFPASSTIGRSILLHWGGAGDPTSGTFHPYNISIENITAVDQTNANTTDDAIIFLSGCYDVKVKNLDCHNITTGIICFSGDYGDQYAAAAQINKSGRGIRLDNITLSDVTYRALKIAGKPTVSGSSQEWPVEVYNTVAFGKSSGSNNGIVLTDCVGPVFNNCRMSGFTFSGISGGEAAHKVKILGGQYDSNGYNGIRGSNSTVKPDSWIIEHAYVHSNNTNNNAGASDKAGINLTQSTNPRVIRVTLGATGETQFYSVRVDSTTVNFELTGNVTDYLAASGVAYSIGSSTDYSIGANGMGNVAGSGITLYSGVPLYFINAAGNKEFSASSAPGSGTWSIGDKVWNSAPTASTATDMGWICASAGTPGTWEPFGDIGT